MSLPYELMHLADSALPAGGFAFSTGLESAVKLGMVSDYRSLVDYLDSFTKQLGDFDLPFMRSLLEEEDDLSAILHAYDAQMPLPVVRRAGNIQGRGFLRLMQAMYPHQDMESVGDWFGEGKARWHYLPVFTLCMRRLECDVAEIERLYLFMMLRDQISAGIRLGVVGPMDGHVLQRNLYSTCEATRVASREKTYREAARTCPVLELAQGYHEFIYSKLFQN